MFCSGVTLREPLHVSKRIYIKSFQQITQFCVDVIGDPWVLIWVSSSIGSSLLIFFNWLQVQTKLKFIYNYKSKIMLKIILKMVEAANDPHSMVCSQGQWGYSQYCIPTLPDKIRKP